ncbi:MAG: hypothetical protein KKA81_14955 [Bacteroidetes bacterium]|nr:hypothetical protein [Bacteroidota bacterium]
MKKTCLSLILAIVSTLITGQTSIDLTFTAQYEGQNVSLDSILIENLTRPGILMVYSDTAISLEITTDISENPSSANGDLNVFQNYPNPARSFTNIEVYIPEDEILNIRITDILGRDLCSHSALCEKGTHKYRLYPGNEQFCFFTASSKNSIRTIKISNSPYAADNKCSLHYMGLKQVSNHFKAYEGIYAFPFLLGDELRFTGYANNSIDILGSDVIQDAPQSNSSYTFTIKEGIPCPGLPWFDYEGKTYRTVQIGGQCWMQDNLDAGSMIPHTTLMQNNGTIDKYCYNDNSANCDVYGGLYQWDEMMNYSTTPGTQGICPAGWHIPTIAEWTELITFLGDYPSEKLKKAGTELWGCSNDMATNESGFTGIPGGAFMDWSGSFLALTLEGDHWSSDDFGTTNGANRGLVCNGVYILEGSYDKHSAISVRCLKNE